MSSLVIRKDNKVFFPKPNVDQLIGMRGGYYEQDKKYDAIGWMARCVSGYETEEELMQWSNDFKKFIPTTHSRTISLLMVCLIIVDIITIEDTFGYHNSSCCNIVCDHFWDSISVSNTPEETLELLETFFEKHSNKIGWIENE